MFTKARTEANAGFERVEVRGRRRSEAANARMVCVEHAVLQTMGLVRTGTQHRQNPPVTTAGIGFVEAALVARSSHFCGWA